MALEGTIASNIDNSVQSSTQTATLPATEAPKRDPNEIRLAHLAKQQKALRLEQVRIKTEREQLARDKAEVESIKGWKQRLSNPHTFLEVAAEAGISPEQLTQLLVSQPSGTDKELFDLKAELKELKDGQGTIQKSMEESQQRQYDQAVNQISNEAGLLIKSNPDKYECLTTHQAQDAVIELIKQTFDSEGYVMSVEDACNEVEEYLTEETVKLMSLKKIKEKLTPKEEVVAARTPAPSLGRKAFTTAIREAKSPNPTLTRQTIPMPTQRAPSAADRRARAIAAMQGKLNT